MDMKYWDELNYWKERFGKEGGKFNNNHYKKIMLTLAGQKDDEFMRNKIVADFGCGPRGSLVWTQMPQIKMGIDVLVDQYYTAFESEMKSHNCLYVKCTEYAIPVPDQSVDILYTINSLDHTKDLLVMTGELLRILKDGGVFLACLNVNEQPTSCEPQTITYDFIQTALAANLDDVYIRSEKRGLKDGYANFYVEPPELTEKPDPQEPHIVWLRGTKKSGAVCSVSSESCVYPAPEKITRSLTPVDITDAFDAEFYMHRNPDVARSMLSPLQHFLQYGCKENRNPAPWFDMKFYLATYPDVQKANINPFLHYLRYGLLEGRKPQK